MKNFRSLPHFHHPEVRNLAWAIGSVPLLNDPDNRTRLNLLDDEWMLDRFTRHLPWLHELDENPSRLEAFLLSEETNLVGKKFEALLKFWFSNSPWFELKASNIQVVQDGRTIGEMDFIVFDKYSDELLHLEAACKYYYSRSGQSNWSDWWGPNHADRLELKMGKFKTQTKLSKTSEGKSALTDLNITNPTPVVFLKGYFFYPFNALGAASKPYLSHPHHQAGWFLNQHQLETFKNSPQQWVILPKTHWISGYHHENNKLPVLNGNELISEAIHSKALLISQIQEGAEISRGLIIRE
jgi:uncharacterized protein